MINIIFVVNVVKFFGVCIDRCGCMIGVGLVFYKWIGIDVVLVLLILIVGQEFLDKYCLCDLLN